MIFFTPSFADKGGYMAARKRRDLNAWASLLDLIDAPDHPANASQKQSPPTTQEPPSQNDATLYNVEVDAPETPDEVTLPAEEQNTTPVHTESPDVIAKEPEVTAPVKEASTAPAPVTTEEDALFWEQVIAAEFGEDIQKAEQKEKAESAAVTIVKKGKKIETKAIAKEEVPSLKREMEEDPFVLTVSALVQQINRKLDEKVGRVAVQGELSNVSKPRSGHVYFSLKDPFGVISAVMFRRYHERLDFPVKNGMEVLCRGGLTMYGVRGKLQIVVDSMELVGIGKLAVAYEKLKEKLDAEGLFLPEHKQPLPTYPKKIGLLTSATGAAIQDLMQVLSRRWPGCSLLLAHCQVQGKEAGKDIVAALTLLDQQEGLDLIILGRGGGSLEDLWPFNEEEVARAVFQARHPIVAGVGHETDTTIVDFVADVRAATPSAAAEVAVPDESVIRERLLEYEQRIARAMRHQLQETRLTLRSLEHEIKPPLHQIERYHRRFEQYEHRLQRGIEKSLEQHRRFDDYERRLIQAMRRQLASEKRVEPRKQRAYRAMKHRIAEQRRRLYLLQSRLERRDPLRQLEQLREQLQARSQRLEYLGQQLLKEKQHQLQLAMRRLQDLSPLRVLERGYALVFDEDERVLRDATQLSEGEQLNIRLSKGRVRAEVKEVLGEES